MHGLTTAAISKELGCGNCARGHYSDVEGQKECTPCLKNSYQADEGMTACDICDTKLG